MSTYAEQHRLEILTEGLRLLQITVETEQCKNLLIFLAELKRWNRRINLTRIDEQEAIEKHLLDSLILLRWLESGESLLDIGSGAGLPGIVIAIAQPNRKVLSIESIGKKIHFQKHIKRYFKLDRLDIIHGRSEDCAAHTRDQAIKAITGRAVSSLSGLAHISRPHLHDGCRIIALRGPHGPSEVENELEDLKALGIAVRHIIPYWLPLSGAPRTAIIMSAAGES